jgi:hypothetical protein
MSNRSMVILAAALVAGSAAASAVEAKPYRAKVSKAAAVARAQAPARVMQPRSPAVYEWGKYQGQDPDINVRLMLRRDVHN